AHGPRSCAVEISSSEIDAGTELTVSCRVSCPHGCDLTGQGVSICDQHGTELASGDLVRREDDFYITSPLVLRAPLDVGEHVYAAVLAAVEVGGILHEETATAFSFTTKAHAASVNVWGLPSAIAAGDRFTFNVGIKCSAGCKLSGRPLSIR